MQRYICIIVAAVCLLSAVTLCVAVVGLPAMSDGETVTKPTLDVAYDDGDSRMAVHRADTEGEYPSAELTAADKLVASNEEIALYYDEKAMTVKVRDLRNDYVWTSAMEDGLDTLSKTWKAFSRALLVIEAIDSANIKAKQYQPDVPDNGYATRYTDNGFEVDVTFSKLNLTITMEFSLTENGLCIEVPDEKIQSDPEQKQKLSKMYIMPFWGAAYQNTYSGYMFVPDGSGALIRYEKPGIYTNGYQEYIYGKDYSINASVLESASVITDDYLGEKETYSVKMPVFGVAHGAQQNAFFARINHGAEYCRLYANPAGNVIDFYWIAPEFIFREIYWVSDQAGLGFNVMQKEPNTVNAKVTYSFLQREDANYTGMAKCYRAQLLREGVLSQMQMSTAQSIPLYVDALMGEAVQSLLNYSTETMTTVKDVSNWVDYLSDEGVGTLTMALRGLEPNGYSARSVRSFRLNGSVGTEKELNVLAERMEAIGGTLTVSKDYTRVHDVQTRTNDQIYSIERRYTVRALNAPLFEQEYYLNLPVAAELVNKWAEQPTYYRNISLDSMATVLFSNYKSGAEYTRSEAVEQTRSLLSRAAEICGSLYLQAPNEYALEYADELYDVPVYHSDYFYVTDCVPFYQTVLSGCKTMFSETMNENVQDTDTTLRLIEFNTYPSYTLTAESANLLVDSNSRDIFGSRAELILPLICEQYRRVNAVLSHTMGREILSRTVPQDGVAVVTYEGDVTVVVNYTHDAFVWQGQPVAGRNAAVFIEGKAVNTNAE